MNNLFVIKPIVGVRRDYSYVDDGGDGDDGDGDGNGDGTLSSCCEKAKSRCKTCFRSTGR